MKTWMWLAGGALLIGGVAAVVVSRGSGPEPVSDVPPPEAPKDGIFGGVLAPLGDSLAVGIGGVVTNILTQEF